MKKLSSNIPAALEILGREVPDARQIARAARVRDMWKEAVEDICKKSAPMFLEHTNAVYLMNKENIRTLIVYVDESIFAAELNARRELFKLKFLDKFKEDIEVFEIHISRGNYKNLKPYQEQADNLSRLRQIDKNPPKPLSEEEKEEVREQALLVEDEKLRNALFKAMVADLEWKKGQNDKNNTQS